MNPIPAPESPLQPSTADPSLPSGSSKQVPVIPLLITGVITAAMLLLAAVDGTNNVYWAALLLSFVSVPTSLVISLVGAFLARSGKPKALIFGLSLLLLGFVLFAIGSSARFTRLF